jgi:hypothetical protein
MLFYSCNFLSDLRRVPPSSATPPKGATLSLSLSGAARLACTRSLARLSDDAQLSLRPRRFPFVVPSLCHRRFSLFMPLSPHADCALPLRFASSSQQTPGQGPPLSLRLTPPEHTRRTIPTSRRWVLITISRAITAPLWHTLKVRVLCPTSMSMSVCVCCNEFVPIPTWGDHTAAASASAITCSLPQIAHSE